jgi:hypothetical protein
MKIGMVPVTGAAAVEALETDIQAGRIVLQGHGIVRARLHQRERI